MTPEEEESEDRLKIQNIAVRMLEVLNPLISEANEKFKQRAIEKGLIDEGDLDSEVNIKEILRKSEVQADGTQSLDSAEIGGIEILESLADRLAIITGGNFELSEKDYFCTIKALRSMDKLSDMAGLEYSGDAKEDLREMTEYKDKYLSNLAESGRL